MLHKSTDNTNSKTEHIKYSASGEEKLLYKYILKQPVLKKVFQHDDVSFLFYPEKYNAQNIDIRYH